MRSLAIFLSLASLANAADLRVGAAVVVITPPEGTPLAGYQMLIRSEIIRGRFRNDYAKPEPFTPGEPTRVRFELLDVLHRFQKGHRLMVQIQSTWFPLVDRNPQTYVPNIYFAKTDDFQKATHRVFRSAAHPSSLKMGVLPAK